MTWKVKKEMIEGGGLKATVRVPDDDILGKVINDNGGREMRIPMRKLVAKLQNSCGGLGWKYSDGWREKNTGYSTFILFRDNN